MREGAHTVSPTHIVRTSENFMYNGGGSVLVAQRTEQRIAGGG